ncbi:MAG: DciA family protein [Acidobacteriota bacterium]|nr:DciA family protein [Acidobacteriota bacterium]
MISAQHCVTGALRELLRDQPLSNGKVAFAWSAAVGHRVDRVTSVALGPDGTLSVVVTDPHWALEVGRSRSLIRSRLNQLLGNETVARLEISTAVL